MMMVLIGCKQHEETTTRVAVAANFGPTAKALRSAMGPEGETIEFSIASTGTLAAQIRQGAPFDLFLSADALTPEVLGREGHAIAQSRFTYARGVLVLWSRDAAPPEGFLSPTFDGRLAIANPRHAPYGRAAIETLEHLGLRAGIEPHLIYGENAAQTAQFARTGSVHAALLALSHAMQIDRGTWREVSEAAHAPTPPGTGFLLTDHPVARRFVDFLQSDQGRSIIRAHGYRDPL